jgi:hypothetical protein
MFKKFLNNNQGIAGNLLLAMILVFVTGASITAFLNLTHDDKNRTQWLQDKFQQELFLRSETTRINLMLDKQLHNFPERRVVINSPDRIATYIINHQEIERQNDGPTSLRRVGSMCVTLNGQRTMSTHLSTQSPMLTYVEKFARRSSLAQYLYFTDKEISDITNVPGGPGAAVRFDGRDVLHGPVHSNDDIWIRNINGGWPRFHNMVTTAGGLRPVITLSSNVKVTSGNGTINDMYKVA